MAVPFAIATQLSQLDDDIVSAGNLDAASFTTLNALAVEAGKLASTIEAAVPAAAGALDTWTPPIMPTDIVSGVLGLLSAAQTQSSLADLEGFVARIEINLENR